MVISILLEVSSCEISWIFILSPIPILPTFKLQNLSCWSEQERILLEGLTQVGA
jgi:hypothetical protein